MIPVNEVPSDFFSGRIVRGEDTPCHLGDASDLNSKEPEGLSRTIRNIRACTGGPSGYYYSIRIILQVLRTAPASLVSAVTSGASQRIDAATKSAS